jgi:tetratricopeptide (TPR) repeat protein
LRKQGYYHARLNHRAQAMELYDLAIQLNPRAAHVHFLRGELHLKMGERNRAIADWQRCLQRLPRHDRARRRLADEGIAQPTGGGLAYIRAGVVALLLIGLIGIVVW